MTPRDRDSARNGEFHRSNVLGTVLAGLGTLRTRARAVLVGRVHWAVLGIAPASAAVLAGLVESRRFALTKGTLEETAIWITAVLTVACLVRWATSRETYFLWAAAVVATLLAREIRFPGASTGVYLVLGTLAVYALGRLERLWSRLASPVLLTSLALGFCVYAISVAIDQRWARALPGEELWHMPVEESLEILGHSVIGLSLLLSRGTTDPVPDLPPVPSLSRTDSR